MNWQINLIYKSKTAKNYIHYDGDAVFVRSLLLFDKDVQTGIDCIVLCEKFGKKLCLRESWWHKDTIGVLKYVTEMELPERPLYGVLKRLDK